MSIKLASLDSLTVGCKSGNGRGDATPSQKVFKVLKRRLVLSKELSASVVLFDVAM